MYFVLQFELISRTKEKKKTLVCHEHFKSTVRHIERVFRSGIAKIIIKSKSTDCNWWHFLRILFLIKFKPLNVHYVPFHNSIVLVCVSSRMERESNGEKKKTENEIKSIISICYWNEIIQFNWSLYTIWTEIFMKSFLCLSELSIKTI